MNNESFKQFVSPYIDQAISQLGGIMVVQDMHDKLSGQMVYFVSGVVCGMVAKTGPHCPVWRQYDAIRLSIDHLNQEEIRRTFDYVRLRLETRSTTS